MDLHFCHRKIPLFSQLSFDVGSNKPKPVKTRPKHAGKPAGRAGHTTNNRLQKLYHFSKRMCFKGFSGISVPRTADVGAAGTFGFFLRWQ
jgi:hypothetical protein